MSKKAEDENFFCGNCKKQYTSKQNWQKHFHIQQVLSSNKPGLVAGVSRKIPNICFETTGPKICQNTLEQAVRDYNQQVKARKKADCYFQFCKRSVSPSPSDQEQPKRAKTNIEINNNIIEDEETSDQANSAPTHQDVTLTSKNPPLVIQTKDAETQTSIDLSLSSHSVEIVENLRLTKEIHQKLFSNKAESELQKQKSENKITEGSEFESNLSLLQNAKSMKDLMENKLMSHFKLKLKAEKLEKDIDIPEELNEHLADKNELLPGIPIENKGDEQEVLNKELSKEDDTNKWVVVCLSCKAKQNPNESRGCFSVGNPNYTAGKSQEKWFRNLKTLLIKHIRKLIHHQRLAIYQALKLQLKDDIKKIHDTCTNMLYFIMKTNSAWMMYPNLLATLYRSGLQVGNINHSRYACETFLPLLDQQMKEATIKWFEEQESVTITADLGTIRGVEILVVLLVSEKDKIVKFVGADIVAGKGGKYLANRMFNVLISEEYLHLDYVELVGKLSGMAGDGVFCKDNAPFKDQMRVIFGEDFKFRWDILHLVNRAHIDAHDRSKGAWGLKKIMDYIQEHSETYRSGLEYNKMILGDLFGFKRPKIKSNTRMANYDYNQVLRFLENSKFFDHPEPILVTAFMFLLVCYVTKIILQISQATDVSTSLIDNVFYKAKGKEVMLKALKMGLRLVSIQESQSIEDIINEYKVVPSSEDEKLPIEDYLINEVCSLVTKKQSDVLGFIKEESRPKRSRSEEKFKNEDACTMLETYVQVYWNGVEERLTHFDKDGTTSWSEAPSESIFSILGYIIEHKPSLTFKNMIQLCRVVKEGPTPGSTAAIEITKKAIANWPAKDGIRFTSNNYFHGVTSSTVANITKE